MCLNMNAAVKLNRQIYSLLKGTVHPKMKIIYKQRYFYMFECWL